MQECKGLKKEVKIYWQVKRGEEGIERSFNWEKGRGADLGWGRL